MNNHDLLEKYKTQMGLVEGPLPSRMEVERVQLYPSGLLKELVEKLINLPRATCVKVNAEALTQSNVSALHHMAKQQGYKLHCLRSGNQRILYVEKIV